ncbi:NAD(+)--dinitrogen-reductase ADP-D-ribosyltransferase [Aestuariirhabdus litorea]|uniref:NAD(+)--dinitrogen-reductase ADP-D-ribosyltransferase n=1 Tax=Aestuariirhabdus litorea TaxID=2528527 RepID=A0A3P3VKM6_9GAMM|nr:NAD(+)--dinitrogen-reductase ADP-D-ribosyltransferase [Aestuariirhabdus litorea]RRJ82934.1 NAD(+)--dinitrogen-reductase ADP-D-ribosyltransferase [Aestuariirhabdus litorea]RWW93093.1 NAD(+)--dinitrogen-reductase ADP-D-ribosyltransferase [Endozoicomonadaceae bacterium GTF-13]
MSGQREQRSPGGAPTGAGQSLCRLPANAYLPINRCNLPAVILGGLGFQQQPAPLYLDGVQALHRDLFERLQRLTDPLQRQQQFIDYLDVHFCLDDPEAAGYVAGASGRPKATWRRTLRGWLFDTDSREGAVMKAWVESRFGLLPRYHRGSIRDFSGDTYRGYLEARARGLYNTNALEAQLDLLYSFCQYELAQSGAEPLYLYRGINRAEALEQVGVNGAGQPVVLLTNLNSFSRELERASEFGDRVMRVQVPRQKLVCHDSLFPGLLKGEGEHLVIGGLYAIEDWVL